MPDKPLKQYENLIKVALIIISASLVLYFCLQNYQFFFDLFYKIISILEPIIYGIMMAYLISPICTFLENCLLNFFSKRLSKDQAEKWARIISVGLSIIILLLMVLLVIMLIIPQLISSIMNFIDNYPTYLAESEKRINELLNSRIFGVREEELITTWRQIAQYLEQFLENEILPNATSLVNNLSIRFISFARSVFNFLIGFIVAAYCLDKRKIFSLQIKKVLFAFLPQGRALDLIERAENANKVFLGFISGKIIDSLIIGAICFVGVLILRIPYAVLISVIIGVTNVIPFFGPFLGAIPCTILIVLEDPLKALYFVIFIFILQQFDGNILGPKILGDSTGITSFWVLFSILLFGGLWGIFGMIIAVPLFVVIYNLFKEITNNHLEKKGLPTPAYYYENPEDLPEEKIKNNEHVYKDKIPQIVMKQVQENKDKKVSDGTKE